MMSEEMREEIVGWITDVRDRINEVAVDYGHLVDHGLGAELDPIIESLDSILTSLRAQLEGGGELSWTQTERAGRAYQESGPWRIRRSWTINGRYDGDWEIARSVIQKPSGIWTQHAVIVKGIETEIEVRALASRLSAILDSPQ